MIAPSGSVCRIFNVNSCASEQRLLLESLKRELDIAVECFDSGVQALSELRARHTDRFPDLIIIPWLLPLLTSAEFLTELKSDKRLSQIPVVILGDVPEAEQEPLYDAGADRIFPKGVTLDSFEQALGKLMTLCIRRPTVR